MRKYGIESVIQASYVARRPVCYIFPGRTAKTQPDPENSLPGEDPTHPVPQCQFAPLHPPPPAQDTFTIYYTPQMHC